MSTVHLLVLGLLVGCGGPRHATVELPARPDPAWDFVAVSVPGAYPAGPWTADDPRFTCDRSAGILSLGAQRDAWPTPLPATVTCSPAHGAAVVIQIVVRP